MTKEKRKKEGEKKEKRGRNEERKHTMIEEEAMELKERE